MTINQQYTYMQDWPRLPMICNSCICISVDLYKLEVALHVCVPHLEYGCLSQEMQQMDRQRNGHTGAGSLNYPISQLFQERGETVYQRKGKLFSIQVLTHNVFPLTCKMRCYHMSFHYGVHNDSSDKFSIKAKCTASCLVPIH